MVSSDETSDEESVASPPQFSTKKKYEFYNEVPNSSTKYWPDNAARNDEIQTKETSMEERDDLSNGTSRSEADEESSDTSSDTSSNSASESSTESSSSEGSVKRFGIEISSEEETSSEESSDSATSCSDMEESEESDNEFFSPEVYQGCPLTVDQGVLTLMKLFVKHRLEKIVIGDVLKGMLKFLPKVHSMPKTGHLLLKYVKDLSPLPPEKIHYYCANCLYYFGPNPQKCENCQGEVCHKFLQLSIAAQIKNFFENHDLADIISNYSEFRKASCQDENVLYDLCDGSVFKGAKVDSPFSLTLLGHTDGLSIHDSANLTLWPTEFVIAEVPPKLRYKFVIISGIWLDECKPSMNTYLKPTVDELIDIGPGVEWTHPQTKVNHISPVRTPGFCADAPARAQLQNIQNHGGTYCCNICEQKMKKLPAQPVLPGVKKKKRRRVFTFEEYKSKLRTSKRMDAQGRESRQKRQNSRSKYFVPVKGVKGLSVVSNIPGCDRSSAVYPEYMHLLLCLVKEFFHLWFEVDGPWSLKDKQDEIDAFLLAIRVPHFITRIPRPTVFSAKWKANELRSFLLYYSPIIFKNCMKEEYFQHWILFVQSLHLLLGSEVAHSDIAKSELMLIIFCRDFKKLYKAEHYTYYVHNVLHLPLATKRFGPLWASGAFHLEGFNGTIADLIHGTKNQCQELVNTVQITCGVAILDARVNGRKLDCNDVPVEFCNEVRKTTLSAEENLLLSQHFNAAYKVFKRAKLSQGYTLTSTVYTRENKRNNFTVAFSNNATKQKEYGDIKCFAVAGNNPDLKVALIRCFAVDHLRVISHTNSGVILNHLVPILETDNVCVVELGSIIEKVLKVRDFVCLRPNHYESNL